MTSGKAIEILQRKRQTEPGGDLGEDWDAIMLGIEALKRVNELRAFGLTTAGSPLPGETED